MASLYAPGSSGHHRHGCENIPDHRRTRLSGQRGAHRRANSCCRLFGFGWGWRLLDAPTIEAVSTRKIASPIGDDDFVRVALAEIDGRLQATPLQRGAGVITSLVRADGLAHIPRFHEGVDRGGTLSISLYQPLAAIRQTAMVMGSHDPMLDLLATHLRMRSGGGADGLGQCRLDRRLGRPAARRGAYGWLSSLRAGIGELQCPLLAALPGG